MLSFAGHIHFLFYNILCLTSPPTPYKNVKAILSSYKKKVVDQFAKLQFEVMLSNIVADQLVTNGYLASTSVAEGF